MRLPAARDKANLPGNREKSGIVETVNASNGSASMIFRSSNLAVPTVRWGRYLPARIWAGTYLSTQLMMVGLTAAIRLWWPTGGDCDVPRVPR